MKTSTCLLLTTALLFSSLHLFAASGEGSAPVSLLSDSGLDGWVEMGSQGAYAVTEGILRAEEPAGYPAWLRSQKEYRNFVLELDYMVPGWCEAGVLLHAPLYGRASRAGYKVHLRHNDLDEGVRSAGSIYDVMAPLEFATKKTREWNHLEITVNSPRIKVKLNDFLIQDLNTSLYPELKWRQESGYIGLQDLGCKISFRDIRIQELPGQDPWTELFNGVNFDGWTIREGGDATWTVEDDRIVARDGDGYLITNESFGSFEFQTMVRTSHHANGGIFFRWGSANSRGYEAQIYNVADATNPTGSLYEVDPASDLKSADGEWFLMQIISDGPYAAVLINGEMVSEAVDLNKEDRGPIALQMHSDGQVEFLRPRIRKLN